jgi:hypothetical protein
MEKKRGSGRFANRFQNLILILNNFQSLQIFGFVSFNSYKNEVEGLI